MSKTLVKSFLLALIAITVACSGDSQGQSKTGKTDAAAKPMEVLEPVTFLNTLNESQDAVILDVRTPGEFAGGHLKNAVNLTINTPGFTSEVSKLDKNKPVFVYCLSGGRSASAVEYLKEQGFTEVYDMKGGMMKWRAEKLPEAGTDVQAVAKGMSSQDYEALLQDDRLVLVDFYAEWCAPCKKMKPYFEEIERENAEKVKVIRIDADANPGLMNTLGIDALPVVNVYRQKELLWSHMGYVDKAGMLEQLK